MTWFHRQGPLIPLLLVLLASSPAVAADTGAPRSLVFTRAFGTGYTAALDGQAVPVAGVEIGRIDVPTGKIVACDPLVCDGIDAFTRPVPTGTFPVQLAIARFGSSDERVAFARILFAGRPALRWVMALRPGQAMKDLRPGYLYGYGVDTGTGAFLDAAAYATFQQEVADEAASERLIAEMNRTYANTRSWLIHPSGPANVALFSSGFGDGFYASYFGLDKAGRVVALVTDFGVIETQAPR